MNKLALVVLFITGNCFGMNNDKIDTAATKFVKLKDYYHNVVPLFNGKSIVKITSFFNFEQNSEPLIKAFTPNNNGHYDIRPLEIALCKASQSSQSLLKKQRGKIGFGAGVLIGAALATYGSKIPKSNE